MDDASNFHRKWRKVNVGYSIEEPRFGAYVSIHTKQDLADDQLDRLLEVLYTTSPEPLTKGGVYGIDMP